MAACFVNKVLLENSSSFAYVVYYCFHATQGGLRVEYYNKGQDAETHQFNLLLQVPKKFKESIWLKSLIS